MLITFNRTGIEAIIQICGRHSTNIFEKLWLQGASPSATWQTFKRPQEDSTGPSHSNELDTSLKHVFFKTVPVQKGGCSGHPHPFRGAWFSIHVLGARVQCLPCFGVHLGLNGSQKATSFCRSGVGSQKQDDSREAERTMLGRRTWSPGLSAFWELSDHLTGTAKTPEYKLKCFTELEKIPETPGNLSWTHSRRDCPAESATWRKPWGAKWRWVWANTLLSGTFKNSVIKEVGLITQLTCLKDQMWRFCRLTKSSVHIFVQKNHNMEMHMWKCKPHPDPYLQKVNIWWL